MPREPTLTEAGQRWLASYVATTRNAKGQRLARTRFERYVLPALASLRPRDITPDHIRELRLELEHVWQLSPYTVMHVLSDVRCLPALGRERERDRAIAVSGARDAAHRRGGAARVQRSRGGHPARVVRVHAGFVVRFLLGTGLRWAEACRASRDHVRGPIARGRPHQVGPATPRPAQR
jgi:integrase